MHLCVLSLPDSRQRRLSAIRKLSGSDIPFELVDGVEPRKMRPETPLRSTGYIIERSLAQQILQQHAVCRKPIDRLYAELSHSGIFYETVKPLVGIQVGLDSDIAVPCIQRRQSIA